MEFKITYEIKGQRRKELVQAISDYLNTIPKYLSVPTCAYEIGELTVDREEGQYKLSTPKTKSSLRVIAIPAELKVILKDHKAWQEKRSEELGSKWKDRGAVVTGMEGEYMSGGYLNITLKKLLKKHDLPDIHVHDLRHANASLLINAGVPVKFISEHLGHSNTKTTEDIYAHVYNSTAEKVASAISDALDGVI